VALLVLLINSVAWTQHRIADSRHAEMASSTDQAIDPLMPAKPLSDERVQTEHLSYALTGFVLALAKGLAELRTRWQPVFSRLWPAVMTVLVVLLMLHKE
jgi:hypothetical protein